MQRPRQIFQRIFVVVAYQFGLAKGTHFVIGRNFRKSKKVAANTQLYDVRMTAEIGNGVIFNSNTDTRCISGTIFHVTSCFSELNSYNDAVFLFS